MSEAGRERRNGESPHDVGLARFAVWYGPAKELASRLAWFEKSRSLASLGRTSVRPRDGVKN
jgi:hypothetical protein